VPTRACGDIPFSGLHAVTELDSVPIVEPTITGDLLELYYTTQPGGQYAIGYARRASPTSAFTVMGTVPFEPANNLPPDASVTADGNLLVYRAEQAGDRHLYYVTRDSGVWSSPRLVPGLDAIDANSLEISGDGLDLYLEAGQLSAARRATRNDAFELNRVPLGADLRYPTVTADGLELFYNDGSGGTLAIKRTTRASELVGFSPGPQVFAGLDPDLTGDGQTLVFAKPNGSGLMMAERVCPEI